MKRVDNQPKPRRWWRLPAEIVGVVVAAGLIALLLRAAVVQVYKIPSESMMDTLGVGSRIAVNRVPVLGKQVERGDVVVFRDTEGWLQTGGPVESTWYAPLGRVFGFSAPDGEQIVVKRVVAVGGDTVACCDADGYLTVNGTAIKEPYIAAGSIPSLTQFEVEVPEDTLWMMGDNRQNSADSVHHYVKGDNAFVPTSSVIGKAELVIWPLSDWATLSEREAFEAVPDGGSSK